MPPNKSPIPRKAQEMKAADFRDWARALEQRARNSADFLEAYAAQDDICLKLQLEKLQPKATP